MSKSLNSKVISTGLAVFSMLFGAGNLMYPILVGFKSGANNVFGMMGFTVTAVLLPIAGLVAMILFDGDYEEFFQRLGKIPGKMIIGLCMIIIGPMIAIPRIVTVSYTMMVPFMPEMPVFVFAVIFLVITFLLAFRESGIVDILGKFISPALLAALSIIIVKGLFGATDKVVALHDAWPTFKENLWLGYETLDLLGGIFFAAIIISILKESFTVTTKKDLHELAVFGFKASLIGTSLLGVVYWGMSYLGVFYGHGLGDINAGEIFRSVSMKVLGSYGAFVIAVAVLMACFSTSIALGAVVAEYAQRNIFNRKLSFASSLAVVLLACLPLSTFGLSTVLKLTGGAITYIGYPALIALTLLNIAYKKFDFEPVKLPVLAVTIFAAISYYWV
jgi:LIVCS family branched-chain amino acid:cation transporter